MWAGAEGRWFRGRTSWIVLPSAILVDGSGFFVENNLATTAHFISILFIKTEILPVSIMLIILLLAGSS